MSTLCMAPGMSLQGTARTAQQGVDGSKEAPGRGRPGRPAAQGAGMQRGAGAGDARQRGPPAVSRLLRLAHKVGGVDVHCVVSFGGGQRGGALCLSGQRFGWLDARLAVHVDGGRAINPENEAAGWCWRSRRRRERCSMVKTPPRAVRACWELRPGSRPLPAPHSCPQAVSPPSVPSTSRWMRTRSPWVKASSGPLQYTKPAGSTVAREPGVGAKPWSHTRA
jgi:hypothetical protein